jgi:hypothetical protein
MQFSGKGCHQQTRFVKECSSFRWKNQRRRQDQSPREQRAEKDGKFPMDPFFFPPSIDGMLVEFEPSSSYHNSVHGPVSSEESVNSNYMELEAAANSYPDSNQYSNNNLAYLFANRYYFYQMQIHYFYLYQIHFHYFFGLPLLPHWIPVSVPYFALYLASIYPIGVEGAALVPPSTAPTGPADVSERLSPPFF